MFHEMVRHLTGSSLDRLREDVARTDGAMEIRDPEALRVGISHLLATVLEIVSDQSTLFDLTAPTVGVSGDDGPAPDNPYDEAIAYLTIAQTVVPENLLRPVTAVLFLLHRSLEFDPAAEGDRVGEEGRETDLLTRMDASLASFGLGGVSLVDLWTHSEDFVDHRRKLWAAVIGVLRTVGEECSLNPGPA